jgi:hypothetical protein
MSGAQTVWLNEKCRHGKCGGDLYLERDWWGNAKAKCLLCSREFALTRKRVKELEKEGLWL